MTIDNFIQSPTALEIVLLALDQRKKGALSEEGLGLVLLRLTDSQDAAYSQERTL